MFDVEFVDTDCPITPERARDLLFYEMKEWYLWNDMTEALSVTDANKDNYIDPYELLEAMRYKALDKWSFVADYWDFMGMEEGDFAGHGISMGLDQNGIARITTIYNQSDLYPNGVRRGWIIEKINNVVITPDLFEGEGLYNLLGPPTPGRSNTFLFIKPSGEKVEITSVKSAFTMNAVLLAEVLQLESGPTGHLVLDTFWEYAYDEIETAFSFFKANGVTDLILDLRYNAGGDLFLADILASHLVGNSLAGNTFLSLKYNSLHQDFNFDIPFFETESPLDLSRVAIITTGLTASASETVINGLKPFMDVVTIGQTTYGKPVAGPIIPFYPLYVAYVIELKAVNSQNEGDYWEGIFPTKNEIDDITHDFNDKEELCLNEAITYLETGSVSTKGVQIFKTTPTYSEKPAWMNNMFIDKNKVLKSKK
jgi:C-terminal processing protease CtpA/Prc